MKSFFRIVKYILRYKMLFSFGILCSFMYAAMNALSVYLIGPFMKTIFMIDQPVETAGKVSTDIALLDSIKISIRSMFDEFIVQESPRETLTLLCFVIIGVIALKNIFSYLQGYIMAYVEQGMIRNLREDIYAAYHRLPLRFYQKRKTGDLMSRVINDCTIINENINSAIINLMREPINFFVLLSFMFIISWRLSLFSLLVAPPSLYIVGKIGKKLRRRTVRTQDRIAAITSVLEETFTGIRVVKAFAMEKFEISRFNEANNAYFKALLRLVRMRRLASPITEVLGVGIGVAVVWYGGILVLEQMTLDPENFLAFILLMFVLMQSAKKMSDVAMKIHVGVAATARVFEIIDQPSDVKNVQSPLPISGLSDSITFKDVWYEYEPGVPVLKDIDLEVKAGENIAIVGPSGGGKSTLIDLIPRFFDPTGGMVWIDGHDIKEYRIEDLRTLFGIVTQETILFHDTIKANIAYGMPDIPLEKVAAAAKTANAHDFIMGFEKGYDTVIGDRGTKLSGGQKQRLVIARAILKNPPVLLFDEATSALDSGAEAEVQAAIEKLMKGRTSFVIAHRLSTVQSATRIIVIDKGRIIESGTHAELIKEDGMYKHLYDLQFTTNTE
ncbi:ABC transporter ATP-binding protein [Candidatus Omnitrophota bacterium]